MGCFSMFSSSSIGNSSPSPQIVYQDRIVYKDRPVKIYKTRTSRKDLPNPNPKNFTIVKSKLINNNLVLELKYTDCTNYEGHKILLFRDTDLPEILEVNNGLIDPHFSDNKKYKHPFARFEPSEHGWDTAIECAEKL